MADLDDFAKHSLAETSEDLKYRGSRNDPFDGEGEISRENGPENFLVSLTDENDLVLDGDKAESELEPVVVDAVVVDPVDDHLN